jgi:thiol-disulfide isomerase/thioredoxin
MNKPIIAVIAAALALSACAGAGTRKLKYVELYTRDCNICNRMPPIIEALALKYPESVNFETYSASGDYGGEIAEKYRTKKYPANLFLDADENLFFKYEGFMDQRSIEDVIDRKLRAMGVTGTAK